MFDYLFTFRSLTAAQRAKALLRDGSVFSVLERAPKRPSGQGCGYVLRVSSGDGMRALRLLRAGGAGFGHLYRLFQNGQLEEVRG